MNDRHDSEAVLRTTLRERLLAVVDDGSLPGCDIFARQYFAGVAVDDLQDLSADDLADAGAAHLSLARDREVGAASVRVFNPDRGDTPAEHTLVQIVTDDKPFLVDSVKMEINRCGLSVLLTIHPIISVTRDGSMRLTGVASPAQHDRTRREAFMCLWVTRCGVEADRIALRDGLQRVLRDVDAAVRDWRAMRETMSSIAERVPGLPVASDQLEETREFLDWLADDHFTFLGYRQYDLIEHDGDDVLRVVSGTGLGILSDEVEPVSTAFSVLPPAIRRHARLPVPIVLTKANARSTVHRPGYLDYIGVKRFDKNGAVTGEHRFLGLHTSSAYHFDPRDIPLLRRKVAKVQERAGFDPVSHSGKALLHILQTFPRDELIQLDDDRLFDTAVGILGLEDRQRVRLFVLPDTYGRFVSCLVYVPRDHYDVALRMRIEAMLKERFNGEQVDFRTELSEKPLARIYFVIRGRQAPDAAIDVKQLEDEIADIVQTWHEKLYRALINKHGENHGSALFRRYQRAFPAAYRDDFGTGTAVTDIDYLESLAGDARTVTLDLSRIDGHDRLRLYRAQEPVTLSAALPLLENFGLRANGERPYCLNIDEQTRLWIHDFDTTADAAPPELLPETVDRFRAAFIRVWTGAVENDGFNALVLGAGLDWRQTSVLRAYCRYQLQIKVPFSQTYMQSALARNPGIARDLVAYFTTRFDPARDDRESAMREVRERVLSATDAVTSPDEDRILRSFLSVIDASVRTNYFQHKDLRDPLYSLAVKLRPGGIPGIPRPHPMFEIFVSAPHMEGVHLRGGKVARGGLRWSDRLEDYRTEVLGLLKAQMVKNAVIVPVGAKGGFVLKRRGDGSAPDRDEVVRAYRTFVQGLLDVTDNLVQGNVTPPVSTVRHDDDDPYLVVAADKGTATFSDIANALAVENAFWLGDAFASGGSTGYDHKKMGITARGGWESVQRHFTELGVDIGTTPFTVVGIGDMAGDVFGNGMLLSPHTRLIAAFNHRHIFVDPDPDPARSFSERQRLFELPQSQWSDYDRNVLSEGGDIYSRGTKRVRLSVAAQRALGASSDQMTPGELIKLILRAPVDLLWNGGIGTFVKASSESHDDANDRGNDALRVNANELRCRVVGEGGNLGFTQRARIEFARRGGLINTDFIDNSGGVDCSDHEVNIKILLNHVVAGGTLGLETRNKLLAEMTQDVANAVLRDNYLQTRAISAAVAQPRRRYGTYARLLRYLERHADLDRALEGLPGDDELSERLRAGQGLTRPELAVVEAYTKLGLYHGLLNSDLPDDPDTYHLLVGYFPAGVAQFDGAIKAHRLRREIISTVLANQIAHSLDFNFPRRISEQSGRDVPDLARAFLVASAIFDLAGLRKRIEELENRVPAAIQTEMNRDLSSLIERASFWLLRNREQPLAISRTTAEFAHQAKALTGRLDQLVSGWERRRHRTRARELRAAGIPDDLAAVVARTASLFSILDIVDISTAAGVDTEFTARVYFEIGRHFQMPWLREQIATLPAESHWQGVAKSGLYTDLYRCQHLLAQAALVHNGLRTPKGRIARWARARAARVARAGDIITDVRKNESPDLATLMVVIREIEMLTA